MERWKIIPYDNGAELDLQRLAVLVVALDETTKWSGPCFFKHINWNNSIFSGQYSVKQFYLFRSYEHVTAPFYYKAFSSNELITCTGCSCCKTFSSK